MSSERLVDTMKDTSADNWVDSPGFKVLSAQQELIMNNNIREHNHINEKIDSISNESKKGDEEICKRLDDMNKRAQESDVRLAVVETKVDGISSSTKWILRTVVGGIVLSIVYGALNEIGLIQKFIGLFN